MGKAGKGKWKEKKRGRGGPHQVWKQIDAITIFHIITDPYCPVYGRSDVK